jgi:hypothetical protein
MREEAVGRLLIGLNDRGLHDLAALDSIDDVPSPRGAAAVPLRRDVDGDDNAIVFWLDGYELRSEWAGLELPIPEVENTVAAVIGSRDSTLSRDPENSVRGEKINRSIQVAAPECIEELANQLFVRLHRTSSSGIMAGEYRRPYQTSLRHVPLASTLLD